MAINPRAPILSVTEINNHVKNLLGSDELLAGLYVRGELSNYKAYPSGHHYFSLKDKDCTIRCVMFKGSAAKLRFKPESGMGVLLFGSVSVYPRDGAYQLYVTSMTPEGAGDLNLALEQLKKKLSAEGLFDESHKKKLPQYPATVAIITSSAGAAVRDMIRILGERWPMTTVKILPVRVQGNEAPPEIIGAIRFANRYSVADLIITGRGGGSIEDLWAFNDEAVARAIYDSDLPVISAVGHEPDVTISDYVADMRASTPSNAAELAVPNQDDMRQVLRSYDIRLEQALGKKLSAARDKLADISARKVLMSPTAYVDEKRISLDYITSRFLAGAEGAISRSRRRYIDQASRLDALSPLKVLARGYGVATDEKGSVIKKTEQVQIGDTLLLRLTDGRLSCKVEDRLED